MSIVHSHGKPKINAPNEDVPEHYLFVGSSINVSQKALHQCPFNPQGDTIWSKVMSHVILYPEFNKISLKCGHFNTKNIKPDNEVSFKNSLVR